MIAPFLYPRGHGQISADGPARPTMAIAWPCRIQDADLMTSETAGPAYSCQDCYPSLTLLPGPRWTGHFFKTPCVPGRQSIAGPARCAVFCFPIAQKSLKTVPTTTLTRGSHTCAKSSFSPLFQPPSPLAWPMTANVPSLARPAARRLPLPRTATFLPVPSQAARLAPCATRSPTSAAKANAPASAARPTHERPSGAAPRVAVSHSDAPPRRAPCSRRS